MQRLDECTPTSKMLQKIAKIYPDLVEGSKVLSLHVPSDSGRRNCLDMELEAKNLLKLIDTLITGVSALNKGENLIIEKPPLLTR